MQREGVHGRKVDLTVMASSIYGGKKWETEARKEGGADRSERVPVAKSTIKSLASMSAAGVKLQTWDIWSQIQKELPNDTVLAEIEPAVLKSNVKARQQLEGFLNEVKRSLSDVPRFGRRKVG